MKYALPLFLILVHCSVVNAQSPESDLRLLDGLHVALKLSNGFNTTNSEHGSGTSRLIGGLVHQHAFNLEINQYLGNKGFFAALNLGYGVNGYRPKTEPETAISLLLGSYYLDLQIFPFTHADLGFGHAWMMNDRWLFKNQIKFGARNSSGSNLSAVSTGSALQLHYRIESATGWHPILRWESSLGYVLKNHDILEFGVFYTWTNALVYSGEYIFYPNNSTGSFSNRGREVGLSLNYVLSGYARRQAIKSDPGKKKDSRQEFKKERRIHYPSSWLAGVRIGTHSARFVVEENSTLRSGSFPELHVGINFNYNTSRNTFWEGDLSLSRYSEVTITQYSASASTGTGDIIFGLGGGWGYRLIGGNNYNWLNISGGVELHFVGNRKGVTGNGRSTISNRDGEILVDAVRTTVVKHRFYPGLYLSLGKDFRLGRDSFISILFTHTEGFFPIVQQMIQTTGQDVNGGSEIFNSNFSGRSNILSIGFKRIFNN